MSETTSTEIQDPATFLQLKDRYKQLLLEDSRLAKAAELAARQHLLLTGPQPDGWKVPRVKAVGRQLHQWTKRVRQPFLTKGRTADEDEDQALEGEDELAAGPVNAWFRKLLSTAKGPPSTPKIKGRLAPSPATPSTSTQRTSLSPTATPRKRPPPKQKPTPAPRPRKLTYTPGDPEADGRSPLPFSDVPGTSPWETGKEYADRLQKDIKRRLRKKGKAAAKSAVKKGWEYFGKRT